MNKVWHVLVRVPAKGVKLEQVIDRLSASLPVTSETVQYVQKSSIYEDKIMHGVIDWPRVYVGSTAGQANKKPERDVLILRKPRNA